MPYERNHPTRPGTWAIPGNGVFMSVYPERGRLLPANIDALFAGRMQVETRLDTAKTVGQSIIAQVVEGKYQITIPSGTALIEPGEVCIIPSGVPVKFTHIPDRQTGWMRSQWVHLRASLFGVVEVSSLISLPLKVEGAQARRIGLLIEACLVEKDRQQGLERSIHSHKLGFEILSELMSLAGAQAQLDDRLAGVIQLSPMLTLVKQNLDKPISVSQIAKWAHLSPSRLHTVFVERLGHAPMSYVRLMRLREAQRLLAGTDYPIAQVAAKTGFACQFHFARCFKKTVGVTPSQYRQEASGN
jgi:AraC-like DNA-binding protein